MKPPAIVGFTLLTLAGVVAVAVPESAFPMIVLAMFAVVLAIVQSVVGAGARGDGTREQRRNRLP